MKKLVIRGASSSQEWSSPGCSCSTSRSTPSRQRDQFRGVECTRGEDQRRCGPDQSVRGRTEITDLDIAINRLQRGVPHPREGHTQPEPLLPDVGSGRGQGVPLRDINLSLIQRTNGSNVGTIIDNASKGSGDSQEDAPVDDAEDDRKFIIDKVEIDNVQVAISVEPLTSERALPR